MKKFAEVADALGASSGISILTISAFIAGWTAIYGGFVFFTDSIDFFKYAAMLAHRGIGSYYYTIGYPLLILLTGFTRTGSIVPVLVMQAAFAALIPWLSFKTFAPFDRKAGIASAVICLASLTPFFFENTFFHDQTCLFFGLTSLTFASQFFHSRASRYIYLSAACSIYAYLAQPAVIGFFAACLGAFTLFALGNRKQVKHVCIVAGLFVAVVVGIKAFEKSSMRHEHAIPAPSALGRQMFFNVYVRAAPYAKLHGVAADRLQMAFIHFFENPPRGLRGYIVGKIGNQKETYQHLFGQYEGKPTQLVSEMFTAPNRDYFEVMWNIPDLSGQVTDRMFLSAALEFLYYHPLAVAEYVWDNLIDFAYGSPWHCLGYTIYPACRGEQQSSFYPAVSDQVTLARGDMPDNAYRFLTARHVSDGWLMRSAVGVWQWVYYDLRLPLLGAMIFGWAASFWVASGLRWTMSAIVAAYLLNMVTYSFLVEPLFRYQVLGLSICAFAAGAGGYVVLQRLGHAVAIMAGTGEVP